MDKKDWIQHFPFKEPRDIQTKSINFAIEQFLNGKKYVILEAPVGTGKSAIATTISKYLLTDLKFMGMQTSWILTTQRILQKQYQKDFPWIPTIWSKAHYECPKKIGVSCQFGTWVNSIFKGKYCDCVYKKDKKEFLEGEISVTNVPFFLNHVEYGHGEIKKRNLLIIDEAHNLQNLITDFISISVNKYIVKDYGLSWIGVNKKIEDVVKWIETQLIPHLEKLKKKLDKEINNFDKSTILTDGAGKTLLKQLDEVDRYICQLYRCVSRFEAKEWVMSINNNQDEITLRPIYASRYSQKQLFALGDKVLLMSGTILDKDTFCRSVGIPVTETAFLSLNSPFPAENRSVFSMKVGSLSYRNIDKSLPKVANAISSLINSEHRNEKGIIHCHSYKVANFITKAVKGNNRFIIHDSSNRMEMYDLHLKSSKPTILVSPSLTEGIDLYDELSRFQIIVKVPFPYLGDNYITTKMKRVPGWYEWETAKTIIQASGRSVRSIDDHCLTYIMDSDFGFFYKRNSHLFPKWYKDALIFI